MYYKTTLLRFHIRVQMYKRVYPQVEPGRMANITFRYGSVWVSHFNYGSGTGKNFGYLQVPSTYTICILNKPVQRTQSENQYKPIILQHAHFSTKFISIIIILPHQMAD